MRTRAVEINGSLVKIERNQHIWQKDGSTRMVREISLRERGKNFQKQLGVAEYIVIKYPGIALSPVCIDGIKKFYLAVVLPDVPDEIERESAYLYQAAKDYDHIIKNKIPLPECSSTRPGDA